MHLHIGYYDNNEIIAQIDDSYIYNKRACSFILLKKKNETTALNTSFICFEKAFLLLLILLRKSIVQFLSHPR